MANYTKPPAETTFQNIFDVPDMRAVTNLRSMRSAAIQPQYAHAPRLTAIADALQETLDATQDLDEFREKVSDVNTAIGVFLDRWGERVGVTRTITINGVSQTLNDDDFRFLVRLKALSNVSGASAEVLNRILSVLFDCPVFVIDNQNMTIDVHILGNPGETKLNILRYFGLPNRPAGVLANIQVIDPESPYFGFAGSGLNPFNVGVFYKNLF